MDTFGKDLTKLPQCAISCITKTCQQLSNTACVCQSEAAGRNDDCILDACSLAEALFVNSLTKTECNIAVRDRSVKLTMTVIVLGAIAASTVGVRLLFKQLCGVKQGLESDDWMILSAVPVGIASIVLTTAGSTAHGLGRDLWGVSQSDLKQFGTCFYILQILYIVLMAQIKLTLCLFYLNIFSGTRIRHLLWATVAFHAAFAAAFFVGVIFQCSPIRYQWDKYDFTSGHLRGGHCININAAGWANGAISVASDVWLLAIPLSQIRRLKLHWKKKIGVALMFLTGAIITIVSAMRLKSIAQYASTANPTWDLWGIVWWSSIEVCSGLICTCLPAMRLLLLRIAPRVFGSESRIQRLPLRSPTPRDPEPPLCSGHTLPSVRSQKVQAESRIATLTAPSHHSELGTPSDHSHDGQADKPSEEC